jgi:hypothetical protein
MQLNSTSLGAKLTSQALAKTKQNIFYERNVSAYKQQTKTLSA